MSYIGKEFRVDTQENFEEFLDSFGDLVKPEVKKVILNHKGTAKLLKDGEDYTLVTSQAFSATDKRVSFKSGVEFDDELNGNKAKTTLTMSGDTLTQVMKFDNGVTFTITREFSDTQLVVSIKATSNGITAKRIYKA